MLIFLRSRCPAGVIDKRDFPSAWKGVPPSNTYSVVEILLRQTPGAWLYWILLEVKWSVAEIYNAFVFIHSLICCSVAQLCPTLCNLMDCSMLGFPVLSPSPWVCSNSCPLSRWCHPTISSSVAPFSSCPQSQKTQHQCLFQWVGSPHQVAKVA